MLTLSAQHPLPELKGVRTPRGWTVTGKCIFNKFCFYKYYKAFCSSEAALLPVLLTLQWHLRGLHFAFLPFVCWFCSADQRDTRRQGLLIQTAHWLTCCSRRALHVKCAGCRSPTALECMSMQRTLTPRCHQQGTGVKEQELISQAGIQVAPAGAVPCLYDLFLLYWWQHWASPGI